MLRAGDLRHRLRIEQPSYTQNQTTGDQVVTWVLLAEVWGKVAPASASEFVAAGAEQSKVAGRITIRHRVDVDPTMRIIHNGLAYNILGVLADRESGLEFMTLPVSEGVRILDDSSGDDVLLNVVDTDENVVDQN